MAEAWGDSAEQIDARIPGNFPDGQEQEQEQEQEQGQEQEQDRDQQSLAQAIHSRRSEYTRPRQLKIKVGSWNVAAHKGTEKDIGGWLIGGKGVAERLSGLKISKEDSSADNAESVEEQEGRHSKRTSTIPKNDAGSVPGDADVGIYAVGLQEVVDITSAAEALKPYTDPAPANRYKEAIQEALPHGYVLVAEQQLLGLLLLVYASPDVASEVTSISTTSVGTGLMGYMGNKGAVTARLVLGETTRIVFVNCHMAAGADSAALDRRNWDAAQITSRTRFAPIVDTGGLGQTRSEGLGDEDFAFWFGDLNYRLQGMPGDDVRRILTLHARDEYNSTRKLDKRIERDLSGMPSGPSSIATNVENPNSHPSDPLETGPIEQEDESAEIDPSSLQATIASLMPHDELSEQMAKRKSFHDGWREGEIKFMPTYKYDVGSVGAFDSSEKRRCPSWCDRILWRTRRDKLLYDKRISEETEAKKRDEQLRERGVDQANEDEEVLFDYDYNPETDGGDDYDEFADDTEPQAVTTKAGFEDEICLEVYTSHQRVLSSDHKPLSAVFALKYDAVVPELKTRIHQEIARELDRAENEGRPTVTVIVDRTAQTNSTKSGKTSGDFEGIDFGDVRYGQSTRRAVTIANTGQVPATVSFIDRPVGADQFGGPMPVWLSGKFDRTPDEAANASDKSQAASTKLTDIDHKVQFTLEPGDATTVILTLRVDLMDLVKTLNKQLASLDDILVLRVELGRDHFLPVRARWLPSALTSSIEKLIRIPEGGMRRLQHQKPSGITGHRTQAAPQTTTPDTSAHTNASEAESKSTASKDHIEPSKQEPLTTEHSHPNDSTVASLDHTIFETSTVRWSAPRELFRLTEAVETLAQRVVAEWDMSHVAPPLLSPITSFAPLSPLSPKPIVSEMSTTSSPSSPVASVTSHVGDQEQKAPWELHSGWPFWEDSWSPWDSDSRKAALFSIYEALDTDTSFDEMIDHNTPALVRLEALSSALITFLSSLDDGVITENLWWQLEADLATRKGQKIVLSNEEERTRVLEVLSEVPAHNISFVLVTSMLSRMIAELTSSDRAASVPITSAGSRARVSSTGASTTPTMTALKAFRRRTLSRATEESDLQDKAEKAVQSRRSLREKAYAVTFGQALFKLPQEPGIKDKEKRTREDRRTEIISMFLVDDS